jgi:Chaperone of endosialidase
VTTGNNNAIPVVIDSAGQLGTVSSSLRYKTEIKPIDKASESILALKPVSFRYRVHKDTTPQFGLIAEEVAKANPDLVIYDSDGKPYTVRYDAVNAMLLNEFLKEHRHLQEQDAIIARQQKQIDALTASLQKVSAQLATTSPSLADLK